MPELPEVEVVRRSLLEPLRDVRLTGVEVRFPQLREPIPVRRLRAASSDRRIVQIRRRSKYLLLDVEGDRTIAVHLGMSGRLLLVHPEVAAVPHEHVVWSLSNGAQLRLVDPRRFGLVLELATSTLDCDRHFAHLGLEPLDEDLAGRIDGADLQRLAAGRRGPVKSFLMDGRLVVGVGNIYACEALHRAGIHPTRSVARIGAPRWQVLADDVVAVLRSAVRQGGTTLNDFRSGTGESGYFQVDLSVYGREGEACTRCSGTIRRIVQANRSTFYCPRCQCCARGDRALG